MVPAAASAGAGPRDVDVQNLAGRARERRTPVDPQETRIPPDCAHDPLGSTARPDGRQEGLGDGRRIHRAHGGTNVRPRVTTMSTRCSREPASQSMWRLE